MKRTPKTTAPARTIDKKSEVQLRALEEQFSSDLVAALRECAAGRWGMFGRNDAVIQTLPPSLREVLKSKTAGQLLEAGEEVEHLRRELGYTESFLPYKRYLECRRMQGSNAPGEPKLARSLLEEIGVGVERTSGGKNPKLQDD